MSETTCAACDCVIDGTAIKVTVGGKTVEVCCEDCAKALNEAYAPTSAGLRPQVTDSYTFCVGGNAPAKA